MTQVNNSFSFSDLPSVDKLLNSAAFKPLLTDYGHTLISQELRGVLEGLRQQIKQQESLNINLKTDDNDLSTEFAKLLQQRLQQHNQSKLRSVFNLTGVVLHTILGRALLPD